jgi:hypothetical protein
VLALALDVCQEGEPDLAGGRSIVLSCGSVQLVDERSGKSEREGRVARLADRR